MVGPTFFHNLQFITKQIIIVFFRKRKRECVDKRTLRSYDIVSFGKGCKYLSHFFNHFPNIPAIGACANPIYNIYTCLHPIFLSLHKLNCCRLNDLLMRQKALIHGLI